MEDKNKAPISADATLSPAVSYLVLGSQLDSEQVDIDLLRIFIAIFKRWRLLISALFAGAIVAATISYFMPNKYKAQILVAPVKNSGSDAISGLRSQFGGIAALAGIDLGGGNAAEESLATLSSRGFAREFVSANNLLPVLFKNRWDAAAQKWKPDAKVPTLEDGVDTFIEDVRTVTEDRRTHLISVATEWYSPEVAANWSNGLVELVNEKLRQDAVNNADQNVKYLKQELERTNVVELQQAIYRVMEAQVNQAMLANVQHQYAFRVIDRAVPPEKRVSPKRRIIVSVGAVGAFAVVFLWLFVHSIVISMRDARQK